MTACHTRTLFSDERETPGERIHEVGKPVWVWGRVELTDVEHVALVFQDGGLVVIDIKVIRSGEEGHDGGEARGSSLPVHPVPVQS